MTCGSDRVRVEWASSCNSYSEWEMKRYAMPIHTPVAFYDPGKAFYMVQSLIQILTSWRGTDFHEHLQLQMARITPITSSDRGFIYTTSVLHNCVQRTTFLLKFPVRLHKNSPQKKEWRKRKIIIHRNDTQNINKRNQSCLYKVSNIYKACMKFWSHILWTNISYLRALLQTNA